MTIENKCYGIKAHQALGDLKVGDYFSTSDPRTTPEPMLYVVLENNSVANAENAGVECFDFNRRRHDAISQHKSVFKVDICFCIKDIILTGRIDED